MCTHDLAAKEAAVDRFLHAYPHVEHARGDHPALDGITRVAWSEIPGCPARTPAVFHGLLDEFAAEEATRLLGILLTDGIFHLSAAMPAALPFLIRLARDRRIPRRDALVDLLVLTADLSQPTAGNERLTLLIGPDTEHPERAECRRAFAENAEAVQALLKDSTLPAGLLTPEERAYLLAATT